MNFKKSLLNHHKILNTVFVNLLQFSFSCSLSKVEYNVHTPFQLNEFITTVTDLLVAFSLKQSDNCYFVFFKDKVPKNHFCLAIL